MLIVSDGQSNIIMAWSVAAYRQSWNWLHFGLGAVESQVTITLMETSKRDLKAHPCSDTSSHRATPNPTKPHPLVPLLSGAVFFKNTTINILFSGGPRVSLSLFVSLPCLSSQRFWRTNSHEQVVKTRECLFFK